MKILIISDSHGNIANLKHVLGFAQKYKVEAVIHAGDWNTVQSVETALSYGIPLYSVLGNADIDLEVGKILSSRCKKFDRVLLEFGLSGRKIGITHKPSDVKNFFGDKKLDIVFTGHYHSKDEREVNEVKIVRPGAIINGINFAIYDTVSGTIEFVNE